jgi:hypothetical protein
MSTTPEDTLVTAPAADKDSEHVQGAAGVKRRDFLKVIGSGTAVAASIGCSSEKVEKLIPYLVSPVSVPLRVASLRKRAMAERSSWKEIRSIR